MEKTKAAARAALDPEAAKAGAALARQPKVSVKIPLNTLNRDDVVVPVCINGYNYFINRGETVEVPQSVAEVLENGGYI